MNITTGQKAPGFTLFNTEKKEISLESLQGKNVLIHFFPLAFTSVCTEQLCNARDNMEAYTRLNCTVLGISIDSLFSLGEFKKQQNLSFDLLSDFNKEVIRLFGIEIEEFAFGMKGVSKRAAFVIDKDGIVQYAEVCPSPGDQPNYSAIKSTLEKLA
ncbi:MAG: redoxin domain-containing protein [Flavobacteriales bacterium]|nr:redoxin domain-containing protein [Flavobacteriales bacterium]